MMTPTEILARLDARPHGKLEREAAKLIREQQARIAELDAAIKRQAAAVRTLHHHEGTEINRLRAKSTEAHRAILTIDSEREMNAILTEENEALLARIAELEADRALSQKA